jgi:hypothetical protein
MSLTLGQQYLNVMTLVLVRTKFLLVAKPKYSCAGSLPHGEPVFLVLQSAVVHLLEKTVL